MTKPTKEQRRYARQYRADYYQGEHLNMFDLRAELHALAERIRRRAPEEAMELHFITEASYRRKLKKGPKARATARELTPELAASIREYAAAHVGWSNRKIGRHFGVDGGRVTDAHDPLKFPPRVAQG